MHVFFGQIHSHLCNHLPPILNILIALPSSIQGLRRPRLLLLLLLQLRMLHGLRRPRPRLPHRGRLSIGSHRRRMLHPLQRLMLQRRRRRHRLGLVLIMRRHGVPRIGGRSLRVHRPRGHCEGRRGSPRRGRGHWRRQRVCHSLAWGRDGRGAIVWQCGRGRRRGGWIPSHAGEITRSNTRLLVMPQSPHKIYRHWNIEGQVP